MKLKGIKIIPYLVLFPALMLVCFLIIILTGKTYQYRNVMLLGLIVFLLSLIPTVISGIVEDQGVIGITDFTLLYQMRKRAAALPHVCLGSPVQHTASESPAFWDLLHRS